MGAVQRFMGSESQGLASFSIDSGLSESWFNLSDALFFFPVL